MQTIALYNIKGGVGKTAAAVNLSYLSSARKRMTLLIDLDPQGSASYYFRVRPPKKLNPKKLLKGGKSIDRKILATDYEYLDILPADFSYRNLDIRLDSANRSRKRLRETLSYFSDEYEYIFIDCPPNITLLAENVFRAADYIMVPLIPTILSLETYDKLLAFFKEEKLPEKKLWPFFSMVELRKSMHSDILNAAPKRYRTILSRYIPYSAEVEKMGLYREPLTARKPGATAARAFTALWQEFTEKTASS